MARQLTQVYLDKAQKDALQRRARARRTNMAAEVRSAVDAYLSGVGPAELKLLDEATAKAEKDIKAMVTCLAVTNRALAKMFARLDQLERHDRKVAA